MPIERVVIVAGPTGSGKSALALAVAEAINGSVINADSMQVYRDLAVVTARPGADVMARVPHRLYGVLEGAEACSAGRWLRMAKAEIAAAEGAGRVPILVGGTGLYLSALLDGLAEVPEIPEEARAAARGLFAEIGGAAFRHRLAELDPEGAARLGPGDRQRLIRAYEVAMATGRPLAEWQRAQGPPPEVQAAVVVLLPPREKLYETLDLRFAEMLAAGAVEEVRRLMARELPRDAPILRAVGVPEIARWLAGEGNREEMLAAAQQATRRYAKRQYTWLRHRLAERQGVRVLRVSAQYSESLRPEILSFIGEFGLTR